MIDKKYLNKIKKAAVNNKSNEIKNNIDNRITLIDEEILQLVQEISNYLSNLLIDFKNDTLNKIYKNQIDRLKGFELKIISEPKEYVFLILRIVCENFMILSYLRNNIETIEQYESLDLLLAIHKLKNDNEKIGFNKEWVKNSDYYSSLIAIANKHNIPFEEPSFKIFKKIGEKEKINYIWSGVNSVKNLWEIIEKYKEFKKIDLYSIFNELSQAVHSSDFTSQMNTMMLRQDINMICRLYAQIVLHISEVFETIKLKEECSYLRIKANILLKAIEYNS